MKKMGLRMNSALPVSPMFPRGTLPRRELAPVSNIEMACGNCNAPAADETSAFLCTFVDLKIIKRSIKAKANERIRVCIRARAGNYHALAAVFFLFIPRERFPHFVDFLGS